MLLKDWIVIASSPLGNAALQIDFQSACFPPPPPPSTTVSAETEPESVKDSEGQFSVDESVDVSTIESVIVVGDSFNSSFVAYNLTVSAKQKSD